MKLKLIAIALIVVFASAEQARADGCGPPAPVRHHRHMVKPAAPALCLGPVPAPIVVAAPPPSIERLRPLTPEERVVIEDRLRQQGIVVNSVPEPGSLALVALGLVAACRRRRT